MRCSMHQIQEVFVQCLKLRRNYKSQQATKKERSKNNSKNQKWGRSVRVPKMGEIKAGNEGNGRRNCGSPNLSQLCLSNSCILSAKSHPKKTKKIRFGEKKKKTLRWMGSSAVVVRLGLFVTVRWLGCRSRIGDREPWWLGFGRRWRTHSAMAGS